MAVWLFRCSSQINQDYIGRWSTVISLLPHSVAIHLQDQLGNIHQTDWRVPFLTFLLKVQKYKMQVERFELFREDIEDLVKLTVDKMAPCIACFKTRFCALSHKLLLGRLSPLEEYAKTLLRFSVFDLILALCFVHILSDCCCVSWLPRTCTTWSLRWF